MSTQSGRQISGSHNSLSTLQWSIITLLLFFIKFTLFYVQLLQHGPSSTGTGQPEEIWRNKVIDSFLTRLAAQTKNISDEELERDYKFVGTTNYSFDGYDGHDWGPKSVCVCRMLLRDN